MFTLNIPLPGIRRQASDSSSGWGIQRILQLSIAVIVAAGLFAFGIVAVSIHGQAQVLGQGMSAHCSEPPADPINIELWEHDSGILVQWDTCPDHTYEIRWRLSAEEPLNPFHWPTTTSLGESGEFDITGLSNNDRYAIQVRSTHHGETRLDTGPWVDEEFATPERCGDLPEVPDNIRIQPGDSKLTVSWRYCEGNRNHIRWRPVSDDAVDEWLTVVDAGQQDSYVIEELANGIQYEIQLRSVLSTPAAVTLPDGEPYRTDWSASFRGSPSSKCPTGEPVVPDEFVLVPGDSALFFSWRSCPEHEYEIAYRPRSRVDSSWPSSDDWEAVIAGDHVIYDLNNGERYEVRMRSIRDGLVSFPTAGYVISPSPAVETNSEPFWEQLVYAVSLVENQRYDDAIATLEASDADPDDEVRYELLPPDPPQTLFPFGVNARDGAVYMYGTLDFEEVEEYALTIRATDLSGASTDHTIEVQVKDIEGPPAPVLNRVCSNDTGVTVSWNRNDTDYVYELERSEVGADEAMWIETEQDRELNLPVASTWAFRVRAIDRGSGEQSKWSAQESVFAGGVPNREPQFQHDEYLFEVLEEQMAGAHVGFAVADDPDINSSIRYRIFESYPEGSPFEIDPIDGTITTTGRLDFETLDSYWLVIGATDLCGLRGTADVDIFVIDNPNVDAIPLVPSPPTIVSRGNQVTVIWASNFEDSYDLDWRLVDDDYPTDPQIPDAVSPALVELPSSETPYAFRLRRVNLLGGAGDWSEETVVTLDTPLPSIAPIEVPRQGQLLGTIEPYFSSVALKPGQSTQIGFNIFDVGGFLDNSLINRQDVSASWNADAGELSGQVGRVNTYTAPEAEGEYTISILVQQAVPGGTLRFELDVVANVIVEQAVATPIGSDVEIPENIYVDDVAYGVIQNSERTEYRPGAAPDVVFDARQGSILGFEWIGANITSEGTASTLQDEIDGYVALGDIYATDFVTPDGVSILNMSFSGGAAICLPVPDEWTTLISSIDVMHVADDGTQSLFELPSRFHAESSSDEPSRVCGHSTSFDGRTFLVIAQEAVPTPTPTATPISPKATPTPTATPTATSTPTATPTPSPTATATPSPTPMPTATATPIPTATSTPTATAVPPTATATATPTAVATPEPTPTFTPVPTSTPVPEPTATASPTPEPTATATASATPTPTSIPTNTPVPAVVQIASTATPTSPEPTAAPEPTPQPASSTEDEDDEGDFPNMLIIAAIIAAMVIGAFVIAYTISANRAQQVSTEPQTQPETIELADDTTSADTVVATSDEVVVESELQPVDDVDDETKYEALVYDSWRSTD